MLSEMVLKPSRVLSVSGAGLTALIIIGRLLLISVNSQLNARRFTVQVFPIMTIAFLAIKKHGLITVISPLVLLVKCVPACRILLMFGILPIIITARRS